MKRVSNKEIVLRTLRERIARHELPPGTVLNEQKLADEFGVSRTLIRDVFANLAHRGLVNRTPNRGSTVARIELGEVYHIYDVREALEGACARLAAQRTTPESWQDLVDLFGEPMDKLLAAGDMEPFTENLETLRQRLITAAGNPVLTEILSGLRDKLYEIARRVIILPGRAEAGLREHRALLQALREGDADAAERLRRENIRSARDHLKKFERFVF